MADLDWVSEANSSCMAGASATRATLSRGPLQSELPGAWTFSRKENKTSAKDCYALLKRFPH
jgi:hypothetical protein